MFLSMANKHVNSSLFNSQIQMLAKHKLDIIGIELWGGNWYDDRNKTSYNGSGGVKRMYVFL